MRERAAFFEVDVGETAPVFWVFDSEGGSFGGMVDWVGIVAVTPGTVGTGTRTAETVLTNVVEVGPLKPSSVQTAIPPAI